MPISSVHGRLRQPARVSSIEEPIDAAGRRQITAASDALSEPLSYLGVDGGTRSGLPADVDGSDPGSMRLPRWRAVLLRASSGGVLWIVGGTLLAAAAAFASSILTARGMVTEERGLYLQIFALSQLCGLVSSLGLTYPILSLSKGASETATYYLRQQVLFLVVASASGAVASFIWAFALSSGLSEPSRVGVAALSAALTVLSVLVTSLQIPGKARQDFQMIGVSSIISGVIPLLGFVILSARSLLTTFTSLLVLALASLLLVGYVIARGRLRTALGPSLPDGRVVRKGSVLGLGLKGLFALGPGVVMISSDVLIAGWAVGLSGASVWAVAKTVSSPVSLIDSIAQNYLPSRLAAAGPSQAARMVRISGAVIGAASLTVGMVCLLLAQVLLVPVFGEPYGEAFLPSMVLVATAVFSGLRVAPTIELHLRFDYRFIYAVNYGIGSFALLVGALAATRFGLVGLATVFLAARVFEAVLLTMRVVAPSTGR